MEYDYKRFAEIYADRTLNNLEKLEDLKKRGDEVYEVTQLINSLYGIVMVPYEMLIKGYYHDGKDHHNTEKNEQFRDFVSSNQHSVILRNIIKSMESDGKIKSVNYSDWNGNSIELVHHLKNSLSHGGQKGLKFFPIPEKGGKSKEITHVIFYDSKYYKDTKKTAEFAMITSLDELKKIVTLINKMFCDMSKNVGDKAGHQYSRNLNKIEDFLGISRKDYS